MGHLLMDALALRRSRGGIAAERELDVVVREVAAAFRRGASFEVQGFGSFHPNPSRFEPASEVVTALAGQAPDAARLGAFASAIVPLFQLTGVGVPGLGTFRRHSDPVRVEWEPDPHLRSPPSLRPGSEPGPLLLALSGPDIPGIASALRDAGLWPDGMPERLAIDEVQRPPKRHWNGGAPDGSFAAHWPSGDLVNVERDGIVKIKRHGISWNPDELLGTLSTVPFEVASFGTIHASWFSSGRRRLSGSFGDWHWPHGWGCAFKGKGHERLVSRRWLEHGPWRWLRGAGDTSLLQFHSLYVSDDVAWEQARAPHERIGISDRGGFMQSGYVYAHAPEGLYSLEQRTLTITVADRAVGEREMLDACAARQLQALGPDRPIDLIRYVFSTAAQARSHLHELWLRGLACSGFDDGVEVRLDDTHSPGVSPPAWVGREKFG